MQFPLTYPVACHTSNVGPHSLFVVIKGDKEDGMHYVMQAIEKGATGIVVQYDATIPQDIMRLIEQKNIMVHRVENSRYALAKLSAQAAGYQPEKLRIIAITGTKGKTTSSYIMEHVLRTAGYKTALLGTVKNSIMDHNLGTGLTTQQPDYLHQFFKLCVEARVDYVVMEVAAQALSLHRTAGILFDALLFTNFSQEHGEFYATLEDYFAAKSTIFKQLKPHAPIIINNDDAWGQRLLQQYPASSSFGLHNKATVQGYNVEQVNNGIIVDVCMPDGTQRFTCPALVGMFNVYNSVGVIALATALAIDSATIQKALTTFSKVPGRLERYTLSNDALCIIDYAHNPSSFESVLSTLRQLTPHLIVVFGCGGDRDKSKRPVMGSIAANYGDMVILTSDNPRSENAEDIIQDIMVGIAPESHNKVVTIIDRKVAIEYAYTHRKPKTIIALLGKGPDEYQIIGNVKSYFSEATIIKELENNSFKG